MLKNTYDKKLAQNRESLKKFVEEEYQKIVNCNDNSLLTGPEKIASEEEIFKQKDKPACFAYIIKNIASLCVQEYRTIYSHNLSSGNVSEYKLFLASTCFDDDTIEYLQNLDKFNLRRIKLYIDAKSRDLVKTLTSSQTLEDAKIETLKKAFFSTEKETIKQSIIVSYVAKKIRLENPRYYRLLQTIHTDGNGNNIDTLEQKISSIYPNLKVAITPQNSTRFSESTRLKYVEAFRNAYNLFLKSEDSIKNAINILNSNNIPATNEAIQLQLKYNFGKTKTFNAIYSSPFYSSPEIQEIKSQVENARLDLKIFYGDISNQLNVLVNNPKNIEMVKNWFKVNFNINNPSEIQIFTVILANTTLICHQNKTLTSVLRAFRNATSATNAYTDQIILSTFKALGTPLKNSDLNEVKKTAELVVRISDTTSKSKTATILATQQNNVILKLNSYLKDEYYRTLVIKDLNDFLAKNPDSDMKISDELITNRLISRLRTYNQALYITISKLNIANLGIGNVLAKLEKLGFSVVKEPTKKEMILSEYNTAINDNKARKDLIERAYNAGYDVDLKLENTKLAHLNNKAMAIFLINENINNIKSPYALTSTAKQMDVTDYCETLTHNLKKTICLNDQLLHLFLSLNSKIRLSDDGKVLNPESIDMLTYLSPKQLKKYKLKNTSTLQKLSESRNLTNEDISEITNTGTVCGNNKYFEGCNLLINLSRFFEKNLDYTIAVVLKRNRDLGSKTDFKRFNKERLTKDEIEKLKAIVSDRFNKYINSSEFTGKNQNREISYNDRYQAVLKYLEICKDVYNENVSINQLEQ